MPTKKCPTCGRTYPGDTYAFCLEDGALLSAPRQGDTAAKSSESGSGNFTPTAVMQRPGTTTPTRTPPLTSTVMSPPVETATRPQPPSTIVAPMPPTASREPQVNQSYPAEKHSSPAFLRLPFLLRGLAALIAGLGLFFGLRTFLWFFALMGLAIFSRGAMALIASIGSYKEYKRGGRFLVDAIASVVVGLILLLMELGRSYSMFRAALLVIPVWAIISGIAEFAAAVNLRSLITGSPLLIATGITSILFGIASTANQILRFPLPFLLMVYFVVSGVLSIIFSLKVRRRITTE
jgi:uncharacterized membrane protein HdeD (DUF308 family)